MDKWRKSFVTTFAVYIGTNHTPWDIKKEKSLKAMRDCWSHVYKSTIAAEYIISGIHDVVFVLVSILTLVKDGANETHRAINDGRSYETPLPALPSMLLMSTSARLGPTPTAQDMTKLSSLRRRMAGCIRWPVMIPMARWYVLAIVNLRAKATIDLDFTICIDLP